MCVHGQKMIRNLCLFKACIIVSLAHSYSLSLTRFIFRMQPSLWQAGGLESWSKLTEGLTAAQKIDSVWWEVSRWHGKLTDVDGRPPGHLKSWWKVFYLQGKLMEVDGRFSSCTRSWQKVSWLLEKLTKVDNMSPVRTENWQNLMEGLPAVQRINESWQKKISGHTEIWR